MNAGRVYGMLAQRGNTQPGPINHRESWDSDAGARTMASGIWYRLNREQVRELQHAVESNAAAIGNPW